MIAKTMKFFALLAIITSTLSGCGHSPKVIESAPPLAGADRDEQGCIGSAGYSWCARESSCVRSWMLAQEKGFANSVEAFEKYCFSVSP